MTGIAVRIGVLCWTLWVATAERWDAARTTVAERCERARTDDRGAINTVELAILTTLVAAAAIAVALIIRAKAEGTANNIPQR
jgi:hypothetical protein